MESLDEVFELFSEERRRYALYYLDEADGPVPIGELASQIQTWEQASSGSPVPEAEFEDIVLRLKHRDLPKAAEVESVHYDREHNRIELSGSSPEFGVILSVAEAIEQPGEDHAPTLG